MFGTGTKRLLVGLIVAGAMALAAGWWTEAARAWRVLLLHNFYFVSLGLMALFFVAMHDVCRASWPVLFRRIPESLVGYLPFGAGVMLLLLWAGTRAIYPWADTGAIATDAVLRAKSSILNEPAFLARVIVIFGVWLACVRYLGNRQRQAEPVAPAVRVRARVRASALFMVVITVTYCVAATDWLMTLEPHWYSTLYPWYVASSMFVGAVAVITVLVLYVRRRGKLKGLNAHHLHDLGKYLFAFSVFWGYLWFSQYLIVWYTNIPEEAAHYALRLGSWSWLFYLNLGIILGVPFVLLPAAWKRNGTLLVTVALVLFAGHWLDLYLLVMPSSGPSGPSLRWWEPLMGAGVGAGFLLAFQRRLGAASLLPVHDPFYKESLHHGG